MNCHRVIVILLALGLVLGAPAGLSSVARRGGLLHAAEPILRGSLQLAPDVRARCLDTLRSGIKSDEFWPSMHAAEALTRAGATDEVITTLRDQLPREQNDQRRCGLARELVRAGDRTHLLVLFAVLDDVQSSGRVHAAESLYKLAAPGDGKSLRAAFGFKENQQLRLMAAAALARSGDADALSFLRNELQSDDRLVRNTVAFAMVWLGAPSDVASLASALDRETQAVSRAVLASALASLDSATGRDEVTRNLSSSDAAVRAISAEAAGNSRLFACQQKLIELLADSTLDVRVRAAQSLLEMSLPVTKR